MEKTCDICGEPIAEGDCYYQMPDGMTVCVEDRHCLEEWAEDYLKCVHYSLT